MPLELRVSMGLYNTEGNCGVGVAHARAERASMLLPLGDDNALDEFAVARHRLEALLEDARVDLLAQFDTGEENAKVDA